MSFHRENVTWQSQDGTWNIGFFTVAWVGSESDGYDPEWDVEYDTTTFGFVSRGHRTPEAAYAAYTRNAANPGGTTLVSFDASDPLIAQYESMADAAAKAGR